VTDAEFRARYDQALTTIHQLTVAALRARFTSVIAPGLDWERAARRVHDRLSWPWTSGEWIAEVDRLALEMHQDEGDDWLTAEFLASRDSAPSC